MEDTRPSPYGKTSPGPLLQAAGMTFELCLKPSQAARFQCLLRENGRPPAWYPALALVSRGGCLIPAISEAPSQGEEYSLWRTIADSAPRKYYLTPRLCGKYLALAKKAGCRFPEKVEAVLVKQGGRLPK